ncbi:MAG: DUF3082 domain-containing protein [Cyanobacteriota bacterium]|nr:DUF3082 domain-containing protein [Cyanobacteriota bacterium]
MESSSSPAPKPELGFWNSLLGTLLAGSLGYGFYLLLNGIAAKLPAISDNAAPLARSLSILIRYFLVGSVALMTFMFGVVTLGLLGLTLQLLGQQIRGWLTKPDPSQL